MLEAARHAVFSDAFVADAMSEYLVPRRTQNIRQGKRRAER
jgi:hypothetical protein